MTFFEIGVDDAERGRTFYEGVFGWRFEPGPSGNGYMIFMPDGRGGIHGGDPGASPYDFFAVDDIDRAHRALQALPRHQGSPFGLHQPPRG